MNSSSRYYVHARPVRSQRPPYNVETTPPGLGWVPVAAKGIAILASTGVFFNWIGQHFKIDYRNEIAKIKDKANCRRCADEPGCWEAYGCSTGTGWLPGSNNDRFYSVLVIQDIVNVYINTALEDTTFPEYNKSVGHVRHTVVDRVSAISGYDKLHVSYALDAIHDLVGRGELLSIFLMPRTAWNNKSSFQTPEQLESTLRQYEERRDPSIFEQVGDFANTLLGIAVIGVVAVGGVFAYDLYKKASA